MDKSSKLIPSSIIAQCDAAITALSQNNDNMLDALASVDTFLGDNDIQSDAFTSMKNQIQNFFAVINLLRTANQADIDDYNTLKNIVGSEELIGSELLEQLEEAMRQKAANEAYINDCKSATSTTSNSSFLKYTSQLFTDFDTLLSYDNLMIQKIQDKIDLYDEIDSKSANLFQTGTNLRQAAKTALEQISASSISGASYVCPSFATIQSTIISNLSTSASMYTAANAYKQNYLDNTEHDVSILSQNLRNGSLDKDDEDNTYSQRFGRIFSLLNTYDSDIKCFQECTFTWKCFLTVALNPLEYECISQKNSKGLRNPIYIKKSKFDVLDSGNFEISEEYYDKKNKLQENRIATWAKVKDKETGKTMVIVNTHLPLDKQRQLECGQQIKEFCEQQGADGHIITGDFNYDSKGNKDAYNYMTSNGLKDMAIASDKEGIQGDTGITFNDYGNPDKQKRIDFFFGSDSLNSDMYTVIDDKFDGKYASDHYGILNYVSFDK